MLSLGRSSIVCGTSRRAKNWTKSFGSAWNPTRTLFRRLQRPSRGRQAASSMSDDLTELYQQVILDHSKSPRNFGKLEGANRTAQGHNPLCGDHVTLYLQMDGDRIKAIRFEGSGCAISKASASLL